MSRRERIVSMALSEKRCFLPLVLVVRGFQDLMTEGDIHRVNEPLLQRDCSYFFQLVTLYFFLYFGFRLRLCISFITSSISIKNIIHQIYLCTKAAIVDCVKLVWSVNCRRFWMISNRKHQIYLCTKA